MSITAKFNESQMAALRAAVSRNPGKVREETANFLVRGMRAYNESIIRSPWRVGGKGGGSPVSDDPRYRYGKRNGPGNLRDTHVRKIGTFDAIIYPTAPYAEYVHKGTGNMKGRPWLDYAQRSQQAVIEKLQEDALNNIINDLSL